MKIIKTLALLPLLSSFFFFGCKDDGDSSPALPTIVQHRIDDSSPNVLYYNSTNTLGQPVELSGSIHYPQTGQIRYAILNCHGTIFNNSQAPSNISTHKSEILYFINHGYFPSNTDTTVLNDALIVEADYLGFGLSSSEVHPYLNADLTAKHSTEALLAAIQYLKEQGREFSPDFFTVVTGYSQGGSVSLATHRYLERLNSADQAVIKFKKSYCGAGPYNPAVMMQGFFQLMTQPETDSNFMVPFIALLTQGMYVSYTSDFTAKGINNVYDYFSFSASTNDPITLLNSKQHYLEHQNNNTGIYDLMASSLKLSTMFSSNFTPAAGNPYYDVLLASLSKNNLTTGWTPQHDVQVYHCTADSMVDLTFTVNLANSMTGTSFTKEQVASGTSLTGEGHFLAPKISRNSYSSETAHSEYCIKEYLPDVLNDIATLK